MVKRIYSPEERLSRGLANSAIFFFGAYITIRVIKFFVDFGIPSWEEVLEFFYALIDPVFITAFFTSLYVIFTLKLFVATRAQANAIKEQNEESIKPNLIVRPEPFGVGGVILKIQNVGRGNAHTVSVDYDLRKEGKSLIKERWTHMLLQPTESVKLFLVDKSYMKFLEEFDEFEFQTACNDDRGRRIKSNKTEINLKKLLENMQGDRWLIETTTGEDIHNISTGIKEVSKKLAKIAENVIPEETRKRKKSELQKMISKLNQQKKAGSSKKKE